MIVTFTSAYIDVAMELFTENFQVHRQNRTAATAVFTFTSDEYIQDVRSWLACASSIGLVSYHHVETI